MSRKRGIPELPALVKHSANARRNALLAVRNDGIGVAMPAILESGLLADKGFAPLLTAELLDGHYEASWFETLCEHGLDLDVQQIYDYLGRWIWNMDESHGTDTDRWCSTDTFLGLVQLCPPGSTLTVNGCNLLTLALICGYNTTSQEDMADDYDDDDGEQRQFIDIEQQRIVDALRIYDRGQLHWIDEGVMLQDLESLDWEETHGRLFVNGEDVSDRLPAIFAANIQLVTSRNLHFALMHSVRRATGLAWFRDWCEAVTPPAKWEWTRGELLERGRWRDTARKVLQAIKARA